MALSELEEAFFTQDDTIVVEPPADDAPTPTADDVPKDDTPPAPTPTDDTPAPVVEYIPPYKGKKYIQVDDEAALYDILDKKYRPTKMSADEKALAFIKQQNPELDDDEIAFTAATKYGIGVQPLSDEELTDEQKIALRQQGIDRKKLISQADSFFIEQAKQIALQETDPLDLDTDYKAYREQAATQKAEALKAQQHIAEINTNFETTAKIVPEFTETIEIDMDGSKFVVPVNFKLDVNKQEQLADFAKRYQPTKAHYDSFNDPQTGKFDYKGYLESLAPMVFAKELNKAATRQALSQDRDKFISTELKNSTLKDNLKQTVAKTEPASVYDAWEFGN